MIKTHGYNRVRMYQNLTLEELTELTNQVQDDPKNQTPKDEKGRPVDTIYIYTASARRRLENISWAITYKLHDLKNAKAALDACPATNGQ